MARATEQERRARHIQCFRSNEARRLTHLYYDLMDFRDSQNFDGTFPDNVYRYTVNATLPIIIEAARRAEKESRE